MNVTERVNVATIEVDFSDERSVFDALMFIMSNSRGGNAYDSSATGSNILTTKVRIIKTLMDYGKHLNSDSYEGLNGREKGSLGDAKRFLENRMKFMLYGKRSP